MEGDDGSSLSLPGLRCGWIGGDCQMVAGSSNCVELDVCACKRKGREFV